MLAEIGSTGYDVMLFLHIASALVAFAPAFAHPLIERQTRSLDAASRGAVLGFLAQNGRRVYAPALILTGLFGFGLQGMSDSVWEIEPDVDLARAGPVGGDERGAARDAAARPRRRWRPVTSRPASASTPAARS